MLTVGVDIGATKINFVLLKNEKVFKKRKVLTPKTKEKIIKLLKEEIRRLISEVKPVEISGIGIGVPGPLDKKGDLILNPPNLKCLKNCPLAKIIEKDLKTKTKMENDVNCFALAEALRGAGKGAKIVFGLTLGSGVGGGIVIDGKIYRGAFGGAGEIGHMTINFNGPKCSCGNYGCLEVYCSEKFLKRKGRSSPKIYQELGNYLGIGLANLVNLFDPEVIIIGGGIGKAADLFLPTAKKIMKKQIISPISKKYVKIKKAKLGDFAGAIGAGLLVKGNLFI